MEFAEFHVPSPEDGDAILKGLDAPAFLLPYLSPLRTRIARVSPCQKQGKTLEAQLRGLDY